MSEAKFPCPECEAELGFSGAVRCKACGWEARRQIAEPKTKFTGHNSNPNDPVCMSCGGVATIYPGVLHGGGKGYCSDCFRRIGRGAFMGKTEDGSQTIKDIREMLNQPLEADVRKRMRSA